ncbi:MAG: radical SAM protein [Bacteroidales bacterium]|nr:radical SAM protein [Bacteroidales bacterium]
MAVQFDDIVFGPIKSRRLGSSLGVNLLPRYGKWCSFDCIYCECGWNKDGRNDTKLPTKEEFYQALKKRLIECREQEIKIDTITFSGNGEPTLHPNFSEIIDSALELRDSLFPSAQISVFSNATQLGRTGIKEALAKVDNPILKLDSSYDGLISIMDRPNPGYSVENVISQLKWFKGDFILQTMFIKGEADGTRVDSTEPELVEGWRKMVLDLRPREVMMYTLDRVPPSIGLKKVTIAEMKYIAAPLIKEGIFVQIRG